MRAARNELAQHAIRMRNTNLRALLADTGRPARYTRRNGPLLLDFSRQKLDDGVLDALGVLAQASGWDAVRDAMFRGEPINESEQRAVLHTALRSGGFPHAALAPAAIRQEIDATLQRMLDLVDALTSGDATRYGLAEGITDIVNLGIGGSDLGPRLACEALAQFHTGRFPCHFLPNVDGHELDTLTRRLDPRRTLVLLVSKSFTTQETLLNGNVLRDWVTQAYGGDAALAARHFVAVSANTAAAERFGIAPERILPMWDFVGGRYSVWSAVGLVLACAIGSDNFRAFLRGAAELDAHFLAAPWRDNLPVLMALIGFWNRNLLNLGSVAVMPYLDRLRELPSYLQQLEMESLGKRVSRGGHTLSSQTVPVIWGSVGTNAQHAFFQALHQGTDIVPVEFIGVIRPAHALQENHDALLANMLAQGAALALGKSVDEALEECLDGSDEQRRVLAAQRTFPGDRPSSTMLIDALTPESFGALLACYEHQVLVQSVLWDINAFDQWGVELGKSLARTIQPALRGGDAGSLDACTQALIDTIRTRR